MRLTDANYLTFSQFGHYIQEPNPNDSNGNEENHMLNVPSDYKTQTLPVLLEQNHREKRASLPTMASTDLRSIQYHNKSE